MDHHLEQQAAESEKKAVKLLGFWASPYVLKVRWALAMKGVEYEYVEEDLWSKSAELLAYNPVHKKVPVLVYQGKPIAESQVILEFIDDAWNHRGDPILPRDPYQRAMARFWARFQHDKVRKKKDSLFACSGSFLCSIILPTSSCILFRTLAALAADLEVVHDGGRGAGGGVRSCRGAAAGPGE